MSSYICCPGDKQWGCSLFGPAENISLPRQPVPAVHAGWSKARRCYSEELRTDTLNWEMNVRGIGKGKSPRADAISSLHMPWNWKETIWGEKERMNNGSKNSCSKFLSKAMLPTNSLQTIDNSSEHELIFCDLWGHRLCEIWSVWLLTELFFGKITTLIFVWRVAREEGD